jgi:hypothetical protein
VKFEKVPVQRGVPAVDALLPLMPSPDFFGVERQPGPCWAETVVRPFEGVSYGSRECFEAANSQADQRVRPHKAYGRGIIAADGSGKVKAMTESPAVVS